MNCAEFERIDPQITQITQISIQPVARLSRITFAGNYLSKIRRKKYSRSQPVPTLLLLTDWNFAPERISSMCGIVGYVGRREAEPLLLDGLRRLEYRGYDSAGMATVTGPRLHLRKRAGRVSALADYLRTKPAPGCLGISHTRWATHGPANDA